MKERGLRLAAYKEFTSSYFIGNLAKSSPNGMYVGEIDNGAFVEDLDKTYSRDVLEAKKNGFIRVTKYFLLKIRSLHPNQQRGAIEDFKRRSLIIYNSCQIISVRLVCEIEKEAKKT